MGCPVYKRVLIKISGEALAHDNKKGELYDFGFMDKVAAVIKNALTRALRSQL